MGALEELKTARDELVLLMATLEPEASQQVVGILARVERAIDILRAPK